MWFEDFQDGCHGGHLGYQNGTILAILNLHTAPMPSTKFPLHPTYCLGADNNWRLAAIMDMILMEMSKMWKVTDRHMDEGWTMVNRPWHKLTWSKAQGELAIEGLQDGCCGGYRGYRNKMFLAILNIYVTPRPPTNFGSIWLTIREQMRFEDCQDRHLWGHLRSDQNYFSNSESLCHSDASHQVLAQSP